MNDVRFSILEICDQTNLEESQARRAFKDLKTFLKPYYKRGEANKILFDQNALAIFKRLKELNELEPSFSEALRSIQTELDDKTLKTISTSPNSKKEVTSDRELYREIEAARLKEQEAKHQLELIKANLKMLPTGGDAEKIKEMIYILAELEQITKPRWGKGTRTKELWIRLKGLIE